MSRIGKQPVPIPDKVKVDVQDHSIKVEGPKGKVSKTFADVVKTLGQRQTRDHRNAAGGQPFR